VHCSAPVKAVDGLNGPELIAIADDDSFGGSPPAAPAPPAMASEPAAAQAFVATSQSDVSDARPDTLLPNPVPADTGLAAYPLSGSPDAETPEPIDRPDPSSRVVTPWGTEPEESTSGVSSAFATGTAMNSTGFAQALFGTASEPDTAPVRPTTLFGGSPQAPLSPSSHTAETPAFGSFSASGSAAPSPAPTPILSVGNPAPPTTDEPVVLDGDGRPMKPMTETEKESFASGLHLINSLDKTGRGRGRWIKRLQRVAVLALLLGGSALVVTLVVPQERRKVWKSQVMEWLEPGMVVTEYLPFDLPWMESSEEERAPIHRQAFQGLDQVKEGMAAHLDQATENLESAFD